MRMPHITSRCWCRRGLTARIGDAEVGSSKPQTSEKLQFPSSKSQKTANPQEPRGLNAWALSSACDMADPATTVMQRIEALGQISEEPGRLTRTFCSPAMRRANELVGSWMREAGMTVRQDAIGNLIGHFPSGTITATDHRSPSTQHATRNTQESPHSDEKLLLLGSHLDTVRDAGKFDGPLGVLTAIACVQQVRDTGARLPFALEVVGFADEEGVRYHSAYLGSKALW